MPTAIPPPLPPLPNTMLFLLLPAPPAPKIRTNTLVTSAGTCHVVVAVITSVTVRTLWKRDSALSASATVGSSVSSPKFSTVSSWSSVPLFRNVGMRLQPEALKRTSTGRPMSSMSDLKSEYVSGMFAFMSREFFVSLSTPSIKSFPPRKLRRRTEAAQAIIFSWHFLLQAVSFRCHSLCRMISD